MLLNIVVMDCHDEGQHQTDVDDQDGCNSWHEDDEKDKLHDAPRRIRYDKSKDWSDGNDGSDSPFVAVASNADDDEDEDDNKNDNVCNNECDSYEFLCYTYD